jgi:hypothetical protein
MSHKRGYTIIDNIDDSIGAHLRALQALPTWTAAKAHLFRTVAKLAIAQRYLYFTGDFRDYPIEHKGQSCLYDVPSTQRGALQVFRGKRIRLICAGKTDGRAGRSYFAKPITPGT